MSRKLDKKGQLDLLRGLADLGAGQAETERREAFIRCFHPLGEHLHAFDPDVVLIVGERGAGKSALFNAVFQYNLLPALARQDPGARLPPFEGDRTRWIQASPIGRDFPDQRGLQRYLAEDENPIRAHDLWFAYLVRVLEKELDPTAREQLGPFLALPGGGPVEVLQAFNEAGDAPLLALDRLDATLEQREQWLYVGYDELDTLGGFDWTTMIRSVRGLLAFWAGYARRWRRLRAKIFLRTDLFRRHAGVGGADLAKLSANRAELTWASRNLYAMLIKRMANTSQELLAYCRSSRSALRFRDEDPDLGFIPTLQRAEEAQPLIVRMAGEYMGATPKKGRTFTWILDHLRDGRYQVVPRSLVRLIEQAARKEQGSLRSRPPHLLHPTSLRQALEDVSHDQVHQAMNNEWPWLDGVSKRIAQAPLVPWERRSLEALLQQDWAGPWSPSNPGLRPPAHNPPELVDYLLELGIFRQRRDGRIDVPDIYLFGFGLRRKGGVKRK